MSKLAKALIGLIAVLASIAGILSWARIEPPWNKGPTIPVSPPITLNPPNSSAFTPVGASCEPTFSCAAHDLTQVESLICKSPELCKLDHEVAAAYTKALSKKFGKAQNPIKREQYYWIQYTRNKCVTDNCLALAHRSRLAEFSR